MPVPVPQLKASHDQFQAARAALLAAMDEGQVIAASRGADTVTLKANGQLVTQPVLYLDQP